MWYDGPHVACLEVDAAFIAEARTALPALLDALEASEARVRALEALDDQRTVLIADMIGLCIGDCGRRTASADEDGLCLACGGHVVLGALGDAEAIEEVLEERDGLQTALNAALELIRLREERP
jgi:hypothetical protein